MEDARHLLEGSQGRGRHVVADADDGAQQRPGSARAPPPPPPRPRVAERGSPAAQGGGAATHRRLARGRGRRRPALVVAVGCHPRVPSHGPPLPLPPPLAAHQGKQRGHRPLALAAQHTVDLVHNDAAAGGCIRRWPQGTCERTSGGAGPGASVCISPHGPPVCRDGSIGRRVCDARGQGRPCAVVRGIDLHDAVTTLGGSHVGQGRLAHAGGAAEEDDLGGGDACVLVAHQCRQGLHPASPVACPASPYAGAACRVRAATLPPPRRPPSSLWPPSSPRTNGSRAARRPPPAAARRRGRGGGTRTRPRNAATREPRG